MTRRLEEGAIAVRLLPDGRELCVYERPFNSILVVGEPWPAPFADNQW